MSTGAALSPQHLCCKAHTPLPTTQPGQTQTPNVHSSQALCSFAHPTVISWSLSQHKNGDQVGGEVELAASPCLLTPLPAWLEGSGCHSLHPCAISLCHPVSVPGPWCSGALALLVLPQERLLLSSFLLQLPCVGVFAPQLPDEAEQVVPMC